MYRLDASNKLEEITVVSVPHMKDSDRQRVISSYKQASSDIIEKMVYKENLATSLEAKKLLSS